MLKLVSDFLNNECGATAIEYGLIAALISTAAVAGFGLVGTTVQDTMDGVAGAMN